MAKQTGLVFTFEINDLPADTFGVLEFSGEEHLSRPFLFTIKLISRLKNILPKKIVDVAGVLKVKYNNDDLQLWHGIVSDFKQGDTGHRGTAYSVEFVPAAHRLSLYDNSRFFLKKDPRQIIQKLMSEKKIAVNLDALPETSPKREYCVQYREDTLSFIDRLAAEEGFFYFFEHTEENDVVTFCDNTYKTPSLKKEIEYNAKSGGKALQPYIRSFAQKTTLASSRVELRDYSFLTPKTTLSEKAEEENLSSQKDRSYEHFDFPGRFKKSCIGKDYTKTRLEHFRKDSYIASGISNNPSIVAGTRFTLKEHPIPEFNSKWLVTSVVHFGTQPQATEETGASGASTYQNEFTVIPNTRQWKPTPTPKPRVDGPQIAKVVGPEGEEINCDSYGRVKVEFPWYLDDRNDQMQSCWVRCSDGWAGGHYGSIAIPRIGHEVIVSFLEGDPDQPIITGRTYHETNKVPYLLDSNKTRTVLRTQSHKAAGHNEVRFEDEDDKEEIYMHAQRDTRMLVENTYTDHIEHNWHSLTKRDEIAMVRKNSHTIVDGEQHIAINKMSSLFVSDSQHIRNSDGHFLEAGSQIHLEAGAKAVIKASNEITVKAGGSFIKITPYGVTISGPAIDLNAGGAAGDGCGFSGVRPELPPVVQRALCADTTLTPEGTPIPATKHDRQSLPVFVPEEKEKLLAFQKKTERKLFVEVTGHDHAEDQYLQFYSLEEDNRLNALEGKKETEKLESSMLHSWDWNDQEKNIDIRLAIKGSEGDIILPLYENVPPRNRRLRDQAHVIQAVVPTTKLPTYEKGIDEHRLIAPLRDGYVYVIYKGKLWREIHVTAPNGEPQFADVNLEAFKDEEGKFIKGYRKPTGNPLKEIWLPYKKDTRRPSVELAYSDVQLSAARLNYYIENNEFSARANTAKYTMPKNMDKMRPRNASIEMNLAEPYKYSRDLSGAYIDETQSKINSDIKTFREGGKPVEELVEKDSPYQLEYGLKAYCLLKKLGGKDNKNVNWNSETSEDYCKDLKQRKIRTSHIDDYLFILRQKAECVYNAKDYISNLLELIEKEKYSEPAILINSIICSPKIEGNPNTLHYCKKQIDLSLGALFSSTLHTAERKMFHEDMHRLQYSLKSVVKTPHSEKFLGDYSSLDSHNSIATHILAFKALRALSINHPQLDYCYTDTCTINKETVLIPINKTTTLKRNLPGPCHHLEYVRSIIDKNSSHPWHNLLFPTKENLNLSKVLHSFSPENDGSGEASSQNIARLEQTTLSKFSSLEDEPLVPELSPIAAVDIGRKTITAVNTILSQAFDIICDLSNDVKTFKFESCYESVFNLGRLIDNRNMGELIYVTKDNVPKNYIIIGKETLDEKLGTTSPKKVINYNSGEKVQANLILTNGVACLESEVPLPTQRFRKNISTKVTAVPRDSKFYATYKKYKSVIEQNSTKASISNYYAKFKIPYAMIAVELLNFKIMSDQLHNKKSFLNRLAFLSATLDATLIGFETFNFATGKNLLGELFLKDSLHSPLRKKFISNFTNATRLQALSAVAGMISAVCTSLQSYELYKKNDIDASIATGLSAIGIFGQSITILTGSAFFSPISIGFFIFIIATTTYGALTTEDRLENWLKNSPFGNMPPLPEYKKFHSPDMAIYGFFDCLFHFNPILLETDKLNYLSNEAKENLTKKGFSHAFFIQYAPWAVLGKKQPKQTIYYQLARAESSIFTKFTKPKTVIAQNGISCPNGTLYYIRTSDFKSNNQKKQRVKLILAIRSQIKVDNCTFPLTIGSNAACKSPSFKKDENGWYSSELLIKRIR